MSKDEKISKEMQELCDKFSQIANGGGYRDFSDFGKELNKDHRTLIQIKFKMVMGFIEELANSFNTSRFDARNQAACEMADLLMSTLKARDLDYKALPFI